MESKNFSSQIKKYDKRKKNKKINKIKYINYQHNFTKF